MPEPRNHVSKPILDKEGFEDLENKFFLIEFEDQSLDIVNGFSKKWDPWVDFLSRKTAVRGEKYKFMYSNIAYFGTIRKVGSYKTCKKKEEQLLSLEPPEEPNTSFFNTTVELSGTKTPCHSQKVSQSSGLSRRASVVESLEAEGPLSKSAKHDDSRAPEPLSTGGSGLCNCAAVNKELVKLLKDVREQLRANQQESKAIRRVLAKENGTKISSQNSNPVFAINTNGKEIDLIKVFGSTPGQYGLNVARELFTVEELKERMLFPKNRRGRPPLDAKKSLLFKTAVEQKFEDGFEIARESVNQSGRDAVNMLSQSQPENGGSANVVTPTSSTVGLAVTSEEINGNGIDIPKSLSSDSEKEK